MYQIFQEPGNMGKVLPGYLSLWTTNMVQEEGVNIIANAEVENVEKVEDQLILSLNNGRKVIMIQTFIIKCYLMCDKCMKFLRLL